MKKCACSNSRCRILIVVLAIALTVGGISYCPQPASSDETDTSNAGQTQDGLAQQIQTLTDGNARISMNAETGLVRFIGTEPTNPIPISSKAKLNLSAEQSARSFLSSYGQLFGIGNQSNELVVMDRNSVENSRSFTHFQQVYENIPVLGGELIIQVNADNNVISASSEILPQISLNVTPNILPSAAQETAIGVVAREYGLSIASLTTSEPQLWIYNPTILGLEQDVTSLVWRMDVVSSDGVFIDELVLVDARFGFVTLHFNQIETAKHRHVYTAKSGGVCTSDIPGTLWRDEGGTATGYTDVDNAYTYTGYTYDYYLSEHGRDSIDNAGMTIVSTVDYDPDGGCDYPNAGWSSSLSQMVFGTGYTSACDVVGHELTHGVTNYESNLFYYMQSGAINEGFSDIWGEFIELTYNPGSPSERWLMGEDLPIGAIRSMKNPPLYGDPDKMTSSYYACGTYWDDNGGVHTNSGIVNKAAYLMADGDTFNGYVVSGIGISKTADLFYEVQTNLLTSGSDYTDLYDALQQAAINLGYSSSEQQTVKNAIDATEMSQQPTNCPANEAPLCASGSPYCSFFDNLENPGSGNWSSGSIVGGNYWYYPGEPNLISFPATYATSGNYNFWGYNYDGIADYYIAMTSDVTLPAYSQYYLYFNHAYDFDYYSPYAYDGGLVEYSTNGGSIWYDAGSLFTHNGYTGTINPNWGNPLGGRSAFVGCSNGYISSRLNLSSMAGQNVRFRFRIGTDDGYDALGWFIDDIQIYTCAYFLNTSVSTGGTIEIPSQGLTGPYEPGQVINISASSSPCYHFVNWSGNTSTIANVSSPSTTITMNDSYTIIANFAIDTFTLTYNADAGGSVNGTTPQTVDCYSDGSAVTAIPDPCYYFVNWSDTSTENPRTDTNVTGDITITANFAPTGATYNLTISSSEYGNVTTPSEGAFGPYACGASVNLSAIADTCCGFVNWTGDIDSIANPNAATTTITMNGSKTIQANFIVTPWDVNCEGSVNVLDMILIGQHWGQTGIPGWIPEDVNGDGTVNVLDMILVGQHWTG